MKASQATLDQNPVVDRDGKAVNDKSGNQYTKSELKEDSNIEGGMKLVANYMKFSYKFNFESKADVKIFQRGCMDTWGSNKDVTYFTGKNKAARTTPNFEFYVNGTAVDMSAMKGIRADALCANRPDDDPLKSSYSDFAELPIGEAALVNGENEFVYERVDSYNYIITDIILIVTPRDHDHEAGANWINTDPDYHWKNCTHNDGYKMEKAAHDFEKKSTTASCEAAGEATYTCKVCGYTKVVAEDKLEHNWGEPGTKIGGAVPYECQTCHAKAYVLDFADTSNSKAAGKFNSGEALWNITGIDAGTYEIYVKACAKSSTVTGAGFMDGTNPRYQWRVDEETYVSPTTGTATYGDKGVGDGESNYQWTKAVSQIDIGAAAAQFEMKFTSTGYSLNVSAVRIVKLSATA